ncbi:hypothetical protein ACRQ5D_28330 [Mucilaginibacter sp. P25]|uniref:hypothetical protein n=1 Tax=unclassified Mucilaginibacter TaxID=2617802 RepID=UPI003D665BE1
MADNRWSKFKVTADVDTDVRSMYEAWATPEGLETWFLRKADFFAIAGRQREPQEFIKKRILIPGIGMGLMIPFPKTDRCWKPTAPIL